MPQPSIKVVLGELGTCLPFEIHDQTHRLHAVARGWQPPYTSLQFDVFQASLDFSDVMCHDAKDSVLVCLFGSIHVLGGALQVGGYRVLGPVLGAQVTM